LQTLAGLHHPRLVAVHDAGTWDGRPFLVMELVDGPTLGYGEADLAQVGMQIGEALAYVHARGVVHRDVKPANILCTSPRVADRSRPPTESERDVWKLADFGIARLPDSTLTVEGQFLGSPSYAAPESLGAGRFSPASDVYGLGATLYEALAGSPPHGHHDIRALVRKLDEDPPPLRTRRAVPSALDAAIMATLARDPARRPTAEELAHLLSLSDIEPRPAPRAPSARTKVLALALAAIAIVLVVLAVTRHRSGAVPGVSPMLAPREQPRAEPRSQFAKPPADELPADEPPTDERSADPRSGAPDMDPPREPEPPNQPAAPDPWGSQPTIVDQYGNPVDDVTARRFLEQMERDARDQLDGFGRKRGKHKRR
jgi:serine/threonine-protein kinase